MSLCPVIGTDVSEAANGVGAPESPVSSCSENGLHTRVHATRPQLLKCGDRVPCHEQGSIDGIPENNKNCVGTEKVWDGPEAPIGTPHNPHSDTQQHTVMVPALSSLHTATHTGEPPLKDMSLPGTRHREKHLSKAVSRDLQNVGTAATDPHRGSHNTDPVQSETEPSSYSAAETEEVEEERDMQHAGNTQVEVTSELTDECPPAPFGPSSAPTEGETSDSSPCPPHVMAQVRVRNVPERERIVRGMQDSKSLDEISQAYSGGARGSGRGGQPEGRRATISSALELEGTVSHDGDLTHFICRNLEQKIKMSSKPSLDCDCDSDCSSTTSSRGRGSSLRRPADIPPIDAAVLVDLQRHTQDVAHSVEMMMRSLNGTIQNMTALSVGYIQTYRDSVDSLGESVDMSIKGMYTLMARCEELDRSMQPIHTLAAQIRDIKRTLDALEAICK
ncbi:hypothetical protein UPYG_G00012430 [Umbra pygmaea]|uniref:BLOC-1-related complex subunit 6 C-terminal helix domain-containing protein n=1 Tax=Umbra pygmaea TaxID=75934 RepID=A0ABD0XIV1_UMBPY